MTWREPPAESCGNVDGPWFHTDASHRPIQPLKTTQGDEPLKVDTGLSHRLPRWAPERERQRSDR